MALLEGDTPIKEPFWEGKGWGEDLLGINACVIATAALQITSDIGAEEPRTTRMSWAIGERSG